MLERGMYFRHSLFISKMKGVFLMKKLIAILAIAVAAFALAGCSASATTPRTMTLATTTSTQDSGLLDYLLPIFKADTGIEVKVIAKGTGEALEMGKRGDADCLLVHAKAKEEQFVKDGYGVERFDVMYNDFIIVGPKSDPGALKTEASSDALAAFKLISSKGLTFISRGDDSGTNTKELALWKNAEIQPAGDWYVSAGKGMGAVLQMASEKQAYTFTDRATYLSMKDKLDLEIVIENCKDLYNQYGIIMVNPDKFSSVKKAEAQEFIDWMLSDKGQKLIAEYGKDKYGQSLFIPNAK